MCGSGLGAAGSVEADVAYEFGEISHGAINGAGKIGV
jgi:hypothetical protein